MHRAKGENAQNRTQHQLQAFHAAYEPSATAVEPCSPHCCPSQAEPTESLLKLHTVSAVSSHHQMHVMQASTDSSVHAAKQIDKAVCVSESVL